MIRIVKMTFRKEHIADFEQLFEARKQKIRNCEGCISLTLLHDKNDARIFFTYSHWQDESFLEQYRTSKLFIDTWQIVKQWFDDKAQAWSVNDIVNL
jgi:(4S)-4-hydroxy-5-phosphonooxypentane-2,3-dione isomerase